MGNIDYNYKKRICFDVDKTIAKEKLPGQSYEDLEPLPGAVETLQKLKKDNWYIIVSSARNMRTFEHNSGAVLAKQLPIIAAWLNKWKIPFDEFWLKPHTSYFVDDKSIEFTSWDKFKDDLPRRIIEDKISEWHSGDSELSLYEYLGWSFEEYKLFAEKNIIPDRDMNIL